MLVAQSCLTLCNSMHCSPPDSSMHGILKTDQTLVSEVPMTFTLGFRSQPQAQVITCVSDQSPIQIRGSHDPLLQFGSVAQSCPTFATPWAAARPPWMTNLLEWLTLNTFSSAQFTQSCPTLATPWTPPCQASLSTTNYQSLFKLMSIESVMPSNHLILCRPFFSHLQSFPASGPFPMSQFFTSGGQSTGVSASASVLPMNI